MTKARLGSQAPKTSRKASTFPGFDICEIEQPEAEQQADTECGENQAISASHDVAGDEDGDDCDDHEETVVATRERGEPRPMPQTPCPLVQPAPSRAPNPTSSPADEQEQPGSSRSNGRQSRRAAA